MPNQLIIEQLETGVLTTDYRHESEQDIEQEFNHLAQFATLLMHQEYRKAHNHEANLNCIQLPAYCQVLCCLDPPLQKGNSK